MNEPRSITFQVLKVAQPIGDFYIASISYKDLISISYADRRSPSTFDQDIGIQRPLKLSRVEEIKRYVKTSDATFPTGIVLSVDEECAIYNKTKNVMTLTELLPRAKDEKKVPFEKIAKILDGQHRLAGLEDYDENNFELNVILFIGLDIADQATIFSTVNLAQTKVNRSLAYDLYELAKTGSPQKTCHNIAIGLDQLEKSPFYQKIKRLGVNTPGRYSETITQATFVQSLLPYLSDNPQGDRNTLLNNRKIKKADAIESKKLIFKNMFIDNKELDIADIILFYYDAIRIRWPKAWSSTERGIMLSKTNGFRAFMRFLRPLYLEITDNVGDIPSVDKCSSVLEEINIEDDDFNTDQFKPGSSGESALYRLLISESGLG